MDCLTRIVPTRLAFEQMRAPSKPEVAQYSNSSPNVFASSSKSIGASGLPNRSWGCDVRLAGLQMAEPLGGSALAHLYESLVGVVFRRQDRDRRVVPVHASKSDDAAGYLCHSVSAKIKSGSRDPSRLNSRSLMRCHERVTDYRFFRSLLD